jgi:hypothetical protein
MDKQMAKFKVVKVALFSYRGKTYTQGDIVDIAEEDIKRLTPNDYLKPVKEKTTAQTSVKTEHLEKLKKPKTLKEPRGKN